MRGGAGGERIGGGWGWRIQICMTTRCNILKAIISGDIIEDA